MTGSINCSHGACSVHAPALDSVPIRSEFVPGRYTLWRPRCSSCRVKCVPGYMYEYSPCLHCSLEVLSSKNVARRCMCCGQTWVLRFGGMDINGAWWLLRP